jgi:hypothetical protein
MTTYKTLQINETNRIVLDYDLTQMTLDEVLGDGVYVHFIFDDRAHMSMDSPIKEELADFINGVSSSNDSNRKYNEVLLPALDGFFTASGYDWSEVTLFGYTQGHWAWAVMYKPKAETPEQDFKLLDCFGAVDAWFKGDIFTMTHETLEIYTRLKDGAILEQWEPADSIGGVMFNDCFDDAEILENAKGCFGLVAE